MEHPQVEIEYLSPEQTPEDQEITIPVLSIQTPLEHFKNLFDAMAQIRAQVITWESKTLIKDNKSRDEAIRLRTLVTSTAAKIEEARKAAQKPIREYVEEMNQLAKDARLPLVGENASDPAGVCGRLTKKINDWAVFCQKEEERMKREALARQKMVEDEIEAREMERKMQEERLRLEEDLRLEKLRQEALEKAQAEGHGDREVQTDDLAADLAMQEEQARIDAARAAREKEEEDKRAAEQKEKDKVQQQTVSTMAVATHKGKVKGVKEIWSIEEVDPDLVPREFCSPDMKKIRKYVESGVSREKDAMKIVPGYRCVVVLGKGGK